VCAREVEAKMLSKLQCLYDAVTLSPGTYNWSNHGKVLLCNFLSANSYITTQLIQLGYMPARDVSEVQSRCPQGCVNQIRSMYRLPA